MSLKYQPEVDGLRAIAVLSVLGVHGFPDLLPCGFLGVDIFFVISGYLLTSIIWEGLEAGRFQLAAFYERRIRRILPALSIVMFTTTIATCFLGFSQDIANFGLSLAAAAMSVSNVLFWREDGYFGPAPETKPLLHTWSLGVEEQFYLTYPLVLVLIHRLWGRRGNRVFVLLLISSLFVALLSSFTRPLASFYFAPFRAWELMLGGLLSITFLPPIKSRWLRETLAVAGWILLLGSLWLKLDVPFPMPGALPVCLGTALLIHVSRSGTTLSCALLATKGCVFVGLISYSLYLWHWPLLAGVRYLSVGHPGVPTTLLTVLSSFILAALTWHFVEKPMRSPRPESGWPRSTVFLITGLVLSAFCAIGGTLAYWPPTPHGERAEQLAARPQPPALGELDPAAAPGPGGAEAQTAVWGDSHASALLPGIETAARRRGQRVRCFSWGGSPPLAGLRRTHQRRHRSRGYAYQQKALADIEDSISIRTVILVANWEIYTKDVEWDEAGSRLTERAAFAAGLERTVSRLLAAKRRVVLVGPVPAFDVPVPRALGMLVAFGEDPQSLVLPMATFELGQRWVMECLDAHRSPSVLRLNPHEAFCQGDSLISMSEGVPLYIDTDHLSPAGAAFVSPLFDPLFENEATIGR